MMNLSVKGISRRYLNKTGSLSVREDLVSDGESVRNRLETAAREEISFSMSECIYGWTASYQQIWTHIIVRIQLNPDTGITDETMVNLRTRWENGIEQLWSDQWATGRLDEARCPFTFEVQWVTASPHHTVRVRPGPARSNMTTWDTADTGNIAAHEYGHMIGHADEYTDTNCPSRNPVNTGTVMDNNSNNVPGRLIQRFADRIDSELVEI